MTMMITLRAYVLPIILVLFQILFCFLLGYHSDYTYTALTNISQYENPPRGIVEFYYPMFMDIHVMMFVGFGFLMTFLSRYSYSAIGFNFVVCAFTLEWAVIIWGYLFDWNYQTQKFIVDVYALIGADFVSASILISMGAVLGKVNAVQLILMAFCEVPIQVVNNYICAQLFCASDAGLSMYVHVFGAYFGLSASFVLYRSDVIDSPKEKSRYTSDVFSMIGTIFLFCFWPSFNAGTLSGAARTIAIVNTYVSLCASVIGAFAISSLLHKGKLDMVHIQNSTLAGGIAVGTVANSSIGLHGAMVIGSLSGALSVLGFRFLLPLLRRFRIHDTCGVHYLHGLPGVMSGITGIIVASMGDRSNFLPGLTSWCLNGGTNRGSSAQAGFQAAALGLTLGMAIVGGLITGLILRIPLFQQTENDYEDGAGWSLPDESESESYIYDAPDEPVKKIPPTSF